MEYFFDLDNIKISYFNFNSNARQIAAGNSVDLATPHKLRDYFWRVSPLLLNNYFPLIMQCGKYILYI